MFLEIAVSQPINFLFELFVTFLSVFFSSFVTNIEVFHLVLSDINCLVYLFLIEYIDFSFYFWLNTLAKFRRVWSNSLWIHEEFWSTFWCSLNSIFFLFMLSWGNFHRSVRFKLLLGSLFWSWSFLISIGKLCWIIKADESLRTNESRLA